MSVIRPWEHFIFYKQSEYTRIEYQMKPNKVVHCPSASEVQLYEYRNRINEYSSSIAPNNWEYYKKIVNPYELVYTKKKYKNFPDCISTIRP
jgi:hypothetical protein